jgi:pullulanase
MSAFNCPRIVRCWWHSLKEGRILFDSDWPSQASPKLICDKGPSDLNLKISLAEQDELFLIQGYCIRGDCIHFRISLKDLPSLNPSADEVYVTGGWSDWSPTAQKMAYGDGAWSVELPLSQVFADDKEEVFFKFVANGEHWIVPKAFTVNRVADGSGNVNLMIQRRATGQHYFRFDLPESDKFFPSNGLRYGKELVWVDPLPVLLGFKSDKPLGARVLGDETHFAIFAPRATSVELHWALPNGDQEDVLLQRDSDGVWEVIAQRNLEGATYSYTIVGEEHPTLQFSKEAHVLDPYAVKVVDNDGLAMVKVIKQKQEFWSPPPLEALVILEAHVKDLTANLPLQSIRNQGFKRISEWLLLDDCYLKQLGINALELQPIQAFDGDHDAYHWGYMPTNYFAIAPDYATDPMRVEEEFQEFVEVAHSQGIAIILDVVYNHVGNPNALAMMDKGYYFRLDAKGQFENWSGCGNDLRTEAPMVKRLIIDSLLHWVRTYDVDGFRFDLADLVGREVLEEIGVALKAVKPGIYLIAEPWSFKSHIGLDLKPTEWSSWNDGFREFLAKYVAGEGSAEGLSYFMRGSMDHLARFPAQTINYVESHDDRTWIDKITENLGHNGFQPTEQDIQRTHLMVATLMASLGVPMLSQGQDFLRSKKGVNNTYLDGALNALDYERANRYPNTAQYFRDWIALRKSPLGLKHFCLKNFPAPSYFKLHTDPHSNAAGIFHGEALCFAINPHARTVLIPFSCSDFNRYRIIADHENVALQGLSSSTVVWSENGICLPPRSCGLWVHKSELDVLEVPDFKGFTQ